MPTTNPHYFYYITHHPQYPLSNLFATLPALIWESLVFNSFWKEIIEEERDDVEERIIESLHYIQTNYSKILILDKLTGEILEEIPLTKQNLDKTWEELLSGGSFILSGSEEVTVC